MSNFQKAFFFIHKILHYKKNWEIFSTIVITGQEFPLALLALHATAKLVARIRPLPPAILVPVSTVTDPPHPLF